MTEEKIAELMKIKVKQVHFAWDNYEDREVIVPKLKEFAEITGWGRKKTTTTSSSATSKIRPGF